MLGVFSGYGSIVISWGWNIVCVEAIRIVVRAIIGVFNSIIDGVVVIGGVIIVGVLVGVEAIVIVVVGTIGVIVVYKIIIVVIVGIVII